MTIVRKVVLFLIFILMVATVYLLLLLAFLGAKLILGHFKCFSYMDKSTQKYKEMFGETSRLTHLLPILCDILFGVLLIVFSLLMLYCWIIWFAYMFL